MALAAGTRVAGAAADRRVNDDGPASPPSCGGDADDLMTEGKRKAGARMPAGRNVQIGTAQPDVDRIHDDFPGTWGGVRDGLDPEGMGAFEHQRPILYRHR
jgi:hypothetical protein